MKYFFDRRLRHIMVFQKMNVLGSQLSGFMQFMVAVALAPVLSGLPSGGKIINKNNFFGIWLKLLFETGVSISEDE